MNPQTDDAANTAASPCADERSYGFHPEAHGAIHDYVDRVHAILDASEDGDVADEVAATLQDVLLVDDLLSASQREPGEAKYRKHILYACPKGRFTLLSLVWTPGQGTPVHGHTAWGAVGVYEGTPNVAVYDCEEIEDERHAVTEKKDVCCTRGDLATVRPGLCDVHRIYNDSDETMITLHTYGLDLVDDPDAINLNLTL